MTYDQAQGLVKAGVGKIVNKENHIQTIKIEDYPVAIQMNYGKAIDNSI